MSDHESVSRPTPMVFIPFFLGELLMADGDPPVVPTAPQNAQDLFNKLPVLDQLEAYVNSQPLFSDAEKAAFINVAEADRVEVSSQIAAAIAAATPPGQNFPDLVVNDNPDDTLSIYLIDTVSGAPKLDKTTVIHAKDIPLPGVIPPVPIPVPVPEPTPVPAPSP